MQKRCLIARRKLLPQQQIPAANIVALNPPTDYWPIPGLIWPEDAPPVGGLIVIPVFPPRSIELLAVGEPVNVSSLIAAHEIVALVTATVPIAPVFDEPTPTGLLDDPEMFKLVTVHVTPF